MKIFRYYLAKVRHSTFRLALTGYETREYVPYSKPLNTGIKDNSYGRYCNTIIRGKATISTT